MSYNTVIRHVFQNDDIVLLSIEPQVSYTFFNTTFYTNFEMFCFQTSGGGFVASKLRKCTYKHCLVSQISPIIYIYIYTERFNGLNCNEELF